MVGPLESSLAAVSSADAPQDANSRRSGNTNFSIAGTQVLGHPCMQAVRYLRLQRRPNLPSRHPSMRKKGMEGIGNNGGKESLSPSSPPPTPDWPVQSGSGPPVQLCRRSWAWRARQNGASTAHASAWPVRPLVYGRERLSLPHRFPRRYPTPGTNAPGGRKYLRAYRYEIDDPSSPRLSGVPPMLSPPDADRAHCLLLLLSSAVGVCCSQGSHLTFQRRVSLTSIPPNKYFSSTS